MAFLNTSMKYNNIVTYIFITHHIYYDFSSFVLSNIYVVKIKYEKMSILIMKQ